MSKIIEIAIDRKGFLFYNDYAENKRGLISHNEYYVLFV